MDRIRFDAGMSAGPDVDPTPENGALLIYAPVPLYRHDGVLYAERQALNGLRLWAANFAHVTCMMPMARQAPPAGWEPVAEHSTDLDRVELVPLPMAYRPDRFVRAYRRTRRDIAGLIGKAQYLSFAIGGLFGDWGAVACYEAHRQGRDYAVWTDRVESQVMRQAIGQGGWRHNLRARLYHRPMARLEKSVIRRAALGLFHGQETYETYAPFCANPQLVHDIHLGKDDHIPDGALTQKCAALASGKAAPLKLLYVGRADPMKGPFDWLRTLRLLNERQIDFDATWLGGGTSLEEMRRFVAEAGLNQRVHLPGFTNDREGLLRQMRDAHLFLFCHLTPESPRCLIEALASGTPVVGYDGAFVRDLISGHGGGRLVVTGDVGALADQVAELAADPEQLAALAGQARADGSPFTDEAVFRHRSELIRHHL